MGLDMYLKKYPRVGLTPRSIDAVEELVSWINRGEKYCNCSFKEWCGYSEEDLPSTYKIVKLLGMVHKAYPAWDEEKKYPEETISEEVGYWRKANAIHNWFVETIQDGMDDCEFHRPVTKSDLEELAEKCSKIICNPESASEILPMKTGFFFGTYEYDEWYMKHIEYTYKLCNDLISEFDFENFDLYYVSSW